jgi:hypothetical protein
VAMGGSGTTVLGDPDPRQVMILVEWESRAALDRYSAALWSSDVFALRERSTAGYAVHVFDRLEDLRPLLDDPDAPTSAGGDEG